MPDIAQPAEKRATTLNALQLQQFIHMLASGRTEGARTGRFAELHRRVLQRDQHFYNLKEADQKLPAPHEDVEPYQTDVLRKTWAELKARMTENAYTFRVVPPREGQARKANDFEKVLQRGFELCEERQDFSIQGDLADGQIISCYGVLHVQRAPYPTFPIADTMDTLEDVDADRYRAREEATDGPGPRHIETEGSRLERDKAQKAKAGFPYYLEVVRPDIFAPIFDRSLANGMGACLTIRTTSLIEYDEKLRRQDHRALGVVSINQYAKKLRIYEETERPAQYDPSAQATVWGEEIRIAQFWTRDEGYELVALTGGDYTLVKSWRHDFGMPPFAIARAFYTNHPDPVLAYLPALEGGYRLKPFVDRAMTAHMAIANQIALPFYYIKLANGSYMLGPSGGPLMLTRDTLSAQVWPEGAELVTITPTMDQSLVESLKLLTEQFMDALPPSGFVEIGASTQPWAIRLGQDQANTIVAMLKRAQATAIQQIARAIAHDMQALGEPVYVYARTQAGGIDTSTAIGIDPADIPTMEIQVDIDPRSGAQAVANIEHMRALVDDPLIPFGPLQFLEEALRSPSPEDDLIEWYAFNIWDQEIRPATTKQLIAQHFGDQFIVSPDMSLVGAGGAAATPADAIQAAGFGVQPTNPDGSPVPQSVQAESQPVMPQMGPITAPGTIPMGGV